MNINHHAEKQTSNRGPGQQLILLNKLSKDQNLSLGIHGDNQRQLKAHLQARTGSYFHAIRVQQWAQYDARKPKLTVN